MFTYHIVSDNSKTTIYMDGDVDIESTEIMEQEIAPRLLSKRDIRIDMSKVLFIDSSGIGLLITLVNMMTDHGGMVEICGLNEDIQQVFTLLQIPDILTQAVFTDF
jgi:anti-anti-sigma factor